MNPAANLKLESLDVLTRNLTTGTFRNIEITDREYLFFGGTAYLGLNAETEFIDLFKMGLDRYGLNNGTSRTNNVQLGIYPEAEKHLARKFGVGDSILVSSGYLAAQMAIKKLSNQKVTFFAPGSHPALWPSLDRPYPDVSFLSWVKETISKIENTSPSDQEYVIVGNTINNVLPELYNYSPFVRLADKRKIHLLLDDSHGIGILDTIEDLRAQMNLRSNAQLKLTIVASLAKGMGIDGGVILSDQETINDLRNSGFYMGASPSAPGFLHTLINGEDIYKRQQQKLQENMKYFQGFLGKNWQFVAGFPVFCKLGSSIQKDLADLGFLISSFPYPDPSDPILDRIVISAAHQQEDLNQLIQALSDLRAL